MSAERSYAELSAAAEARALKVTGCLSLGPKDRLAERFVTLLLLSPSPNGFWDVFTGSPEYQDHAQNGTPDPMDRWSRRVIGTWACDLGGKAVFPFGGPPYRPFLRWAEDSGRVWPSPTGPLVQDALGLMISYRGALALPFVLPSPAPLDASPCDTCATRPCVSACPVGALSASRPYDVPACKAHLRGDSGAACLSGCLVRKACPASAGAQRVDAHSAYHMDIFQRTP